MRKILLPALVLAAILDGWADDLRQPPTPAQRAALVASGWPDAAQKLQSALVAAYQPGGPSRPGSTGVTAYRSWLTLWKWADLLSRGEKDEAVRFLIAHMRWVPENDQPIVFPPGVAIPPEFPPLTEAQRESIARSADSLGRPWRTLLPDDLATPGNGRIADGLDPAAVTEWINDDELSRALFDHLSDSDYAAGVLARLQEIWRANPQKFREYRSLAVALALVYDQRLPDFWPHRQVDPALVPRSKATVAELFAQWVEANESRKLLLDLRSLRPDQIKFIVDAPIDESELAWARKNVRYGRASFDRAFGDVSYVTARIRNGEFVWHGDEYTLENLRRRGGICVDQAYYAMITGKARGLPTLFFVGQGTDGGHAWFGYMKTDDRWVLDAGRYENQNYAIGEALDPQTWLPVSDHELEFMARSDRAALNFVASEDDLRLARLLEAAGQTDRALRAYDSSISVAPMNDRAWAAKGEFLARSGAALDVRRSHHEAAAKQFANQRDIRALHQAAVAEIARAQGDVAAAEAMEKQIVSQNKRRRSDLSVGVVARQLEELVAAGKFDDAFSEYRRQIANLGKSGGGTLFYEVVQPFAVALLEAGDAARARDAVAMARKQLNPEAGSILDGDLKRLNERLDSPESR